MTKQDFDKFFRALSEAITSVQPILVQRHEWHLLGVLQEIEQEIITCRGDEALVRAAQLVPKLDFCVSKGLNVFESLTGFAHRCLTAVEQAQNERSVRQEALARRLFSMHQYLNGVSGAEQFGRVQAERDEDIAYGLGLGLHDGTLLRYLSHLAAGDVIERCFDDDAPELLDAVRGGQTCLERYFSEHRVLRYDPVLARKKVDLSDDLLNRLIRLGMEPEARREQICILAGKRFDAAKRFAKTSEIKSLRGFAMLFDIDAHSAETTMERVGSSAGESQKCLTLADAVISKMHGRMALHWQSRLESVFRGCGCVDGRLYDEARFFGENIARKAWENTAELPLFEDERLSPEPKAGHYYIVRDGDCLSALTDKVYGAREDYRIVLRENPQIRHPGMLQPGMKMYFPNSEVQNCALQPPDHTGHAEFIDEARMIAYGGREITAVEPLTEKQLKLLCDVLSKIPENELFHARVVALPVGGVLVCDRTMLCMTEADNEKRANELYPNNSSPLMTWLNILAAQIRGDIVIGPDSFLPLASIPSQSHRQVWMGTAIRRLIQDKSAQPVKFLVHAQTRCVDILDAHDEKVLRLETEDFLAIRRQPQRRLSDYIAVPWVQMNDLTQIWLASAFGIDLEICVSPVSHVNQYAQNSPEDECHFLVPMGTGVYPIMRGTVVDCGAFPVTGYGVLIKHHNGLYSRYSSLAAICVQPGQIVTADTMIGRSGSSNAEGQPMLRLELKYSEKVIVLWDHFEGKRIDYSGLVDHLWPADPMFESIAGD